MKRTLALVLMLVVLGAVPAFAGDDPKDFQVTTNVVPSCKFTNSADVNFGDLGVTRFGTFPGQGSLQILCTKGGLYTIDLGVGDNDGGTGQRKMTLFGVAFLPYDLFQDQDTLKVWKSGPDALNYTGSGLRDTVTIYGTLVWMEETLKDAPVGSYFDTVRATVNF